MNKFVIIQNNRKERQNNIKLLNIKNGGRGSAKITPPSESRRS